MSHFEVRRGLTLIEILVAITLIVLLTGVYFMVANPGGQLAASRNNARSLNLETIMIAIRQNIADQGSETFSCSSGALPAAPTDMSSASGGYNIAPCLVPNYLPAMPVDPAASSSYYRSPTDYDTGYTIMQNSSGSITLAAPNAELQTVITLTR